MNKKHSGNEEWKITEAPSQYDNLELMPLEEVLNGINSEDMKVAKSIRPLIPKVTQLVSQIAEKFLKDGRLFYIGAGTSGRLGILDASEIPPTYGLPHDKVIGLIAGGDNAIKRSVEFAEDDWEAAENDLKKHFLNKKDTVIGIAASGTTPYVIGGIKYAKSLGCLTACITNNLNTPLCLESQIVLEAVVGPEYVTGSTRMKSGTAQKMLLNMISTSLMIKIGRVKGNKMVNMQLNNEKLLRRGTRFIMQELGVSQHTASNLLKQYGSVKEAFQQAQKIKPSMNT